MNNDLKTGGEVAGMTCRKCGAIDTVSLLPGGWYACSSCHDNFSLTVERQPESQSLDKVVRIEPMTEHESEIRLFSILSLFFGSMTAFFFYYAVSHVIDPISKDPMSGRMFGLMLVPFGIWSLECWRAIVGFSNRDFVKVLIFGFGLAFACVFVPSTIWAFFWGSGFLHFLSVFNVILILGFLVLWAFLIEMQKARIRGGEDPKIVQEEFVELIEDSFYARNMSWLHHYQLMRKHHRERKRRR